MPRFPGFIGPSYTLNSLNVDCQRTVNLYPEINESGHGKEGEVISLVPTPGLQLLATLGAGPIRGEYTASNGRMFCVSNNTLYEIDSDFNYTTLGTLDSDSGQVSMADDGYYLVVVDGADGFQFEFETNTYSQIVDPAWLGADQVVVIDGYFVFNRPDSSGFYLSSSVSERLIADPTNMQPTFPGDEAPVDGDPDNNVAMIGNNGNLWMLNERTTEIYYNSGDTFPFARISGAFIEYGCAARFSVAKMQNTIFWLSKDDKGSGLVMMAEGYQPKKISTTPVEIAISSYSDIEGAVGYCYQENGHHFYVLNFPSADTTWVYDTTSGFWHERTYTQDGAQERHRANCHAFAFNTHIVGDYENGNLYRLTSSVKSDNGSEIKRQRVAPHLSSGGKRVFYHLFRLDIETGVGLDGIGQGTDPKVILEFSDDGGHSWSNEKWRSIGRIGQRKTQVKWDRLGSSRDRVFRITISDPVKVTLIGADLDFTVGDS